MADRMRLFSLLLMVLMLPVMSGAHAQDAGVEPQGYRALIDAGLAEYDADNFLEARAIFAKAHALYPNARTLRVLGMTEFELRHYDESATYLRDALASKVRPLDGALRDETQALLDRTAQFLGRLHLSLQPANAQLQVDGEPATLPAEGLVLQLGEHVLDVSAEAYQADRRTIDIAGGEDKTLAIALRPELAVAENTAAPQPMAAAESKPLYASPWLWAGVGVVVIGVAVGLIVALQPSTKTEIGAPLKTSQTPDGVASLQALRGP